MLTTNKARICHKSEEKYYLLDSSFFCELYKVFRRCGIGWYMYAYKHVVCFQVAKNLIARFNQ